MNEFYDQAIPYLLNGQWEESLGLLRKAKEVNPKCPVVRRMLSSVLLTLGYFKEGLEEFECRFEMPLEDSPNLAGFEVGAKIRLRYYKTPYWDGKKDIKNKTILVFNEGGAGDIIQNVRYLSELKSKCNKVVFECKQELCKLIDGTQGIDELTPCGSISSMLFFEKPYSKPIDYVVSLHSLMHYFDPELNNIPFKFPYLTVKSSDSEALEIVDKYKDKFKIGIVWAGIKGHGNDKRRSTFKKNFRHLQDMPNSQLFSLQKGEMFRRWNNEVNLLEESDTMTDINLGPRLKDFNDTAAVLEKLDMLVTVDTSVAHLAGALNVPICLVLPTKQWAEWRWQKNWYSSVEKFYMKDNWEELIKEIVDLR